MLDTTTTDQVTAFLTEFGGALAAGSIEAATAMFQDDCFWRDLLTFTSNIKTMEGCAEVADLLHNHLAAAKPQNWRIANGETPAEQGGIATAWISFEMGVAQCHGKIRLKDGKKSVRCLPPWWS